MEPNRTLLGSVPSARGRYLDSDGVFGKLVEPFPWPGEAPSVAAQAVRAAGDDTLHHGDRTGPDRTEPSRAEPTGLTEHARTDR